MPPQMREVKLLRRRIEDVATAFGNNAAWNCCCDQKAPLLGSTLNAPDVSCSCGRLYRVVAEGEKGSRAVRVEEIEP